MRFVAAALLLLCAAGCGAVYNSGLRGKLETRASFDMNCPAKQLEFTELASTNGMITTYGVRGCGSQATYVLDVHSATWLLNTARKPAE